MKIQENANLIGGFNPMAYITSTSFAPVSRASGRGHKLVGYWLNAASTNIQSNSNEIKMRLDDHCAHHGCYLNSFESDNGQSANPIRMGLWRAIRRTVCENCPPKRMPMTFMNVDDFMAQALAPCPCGGKGVDGIIVTSMKHLCSDPVKGSQIVLKMAEAGKHFVAEDGICLSCCHPATKQMMQKKKLLVAS